MKSKLRSLGITMIAVLAVLLLGAEASLAGNGSIAGNYLCRSTQGNPCSTNTPLQLVSNGSWRWGRYNGTYTVGNGRIEFNGVGGPASWGGAAVGPDTLTFNDFGDNSVWQKPSSAPPQISGVYFCSTAPGGCQTSHPLEIRADGTWAWGSGHGSYSVMGNQVRFSGITWGPGGWGMADIGPGTLTFHDARGASVWSTAGPKRGPMTQPSSGSAQNFTGDPREFDLSGFPPRPTTFDEQRILAAIQSARDPRYSANPAVFQEQGHRMLGQWYFNHGDQSRGMNEHAKALYWKNGGQ